MSRSGYNEDCDGWSLIMWRGAVASALRGARGQAFLRDMIAALDAMPVKELAAETLATDGAVCAMGAVGTMRGVDMSKLDPEDPKTAAHVLGIATAMAREIAYENDEGRWKETPAERWRRMRQWAESHIRAAESEIGKQP